MYIYINVYNLANYKVRLTNKNPCCMKQKIQAVSSERVAQVSLSSVSGYACRHLLELSFVVGDAFRGTILCRTLQHHNMDSPGGVAPARPDPALPVPSKTRLNVWDGQCADGRHEGEMSTFHWAWCWTLRARQSWAVLKENSAKAKSH